MSTCWTTGRRAGLHLFIPHPVACRLFLLNHVPLYRSSIFLIQLTAVKIVKPSFFHCGSGKQYKISNRQAHAFQVWWFLSFNGSLVRLNILDFFVRCLFSWTCAAKSTKLKPLRVEREEEKSESRKYTFLLFWLFEFLPDAFPAEHAQLFFPA